MIMEYNDFNMGSGLVYKNDVYEYSSFKTPNPVIIKTVGQHCMDPTTRLENPQNPTKNHIDSPFGEIKIIKSKLR